MTYSDESRVEKGMDNLEPSRTAGGHIEDRGQPGLPVTHRKLANPAPLGLLSFATVIFLISTFGLHTRGIQTANMIMSVLLFFGGVGQYITGIMEFFSGNTFGATVFCSYGAFNLSYGLIYLPGSGIIAAYTDPITQALMPEFNQALSIYLFAWFILTVLFTLAAVRSSWVLLIDLVAFDIFLGLLAAGFMAESQSVLKAGYAFGYVVCILSYWAGCAGLFNGGLTPFEIPVFPLIKEE